MQFRKFLYFVFLIVACQNLSACIWARRCPEQSCRVATEHKHESGAYRPRAAFSWVTTKKHWPWHAFGNGKKKYNGKKDKKTGKTKFKYLLPGEKVD
jgi:ribosomal protein L44E